MNSPTKKKPSVTRHHLRVKFPLGADSSSSRFFGDPDRIQFGAIPYSYRGDVFTGLYSTNMTLVDCTVPIAIGT
jgi:hypothetical protein